MMGLPDPWARPKPNVLANLHGWFSDEKRKTMRKLIERKKPKRFLEIGAWLGQSTIFFADFCQVVTVDSWLGSPKHWKEADRVEKFLPTLYETFLVNCWEKQDKIFPVRMASIAALKFFQIKKIEFDMIYLDGDHRYEAVKADLEEIVKLPGNPFVTGDDWFRNEGMKDCVQTAVREVYGNRVKNEGITWWIE